MKLAFVVASLLVSSAAVAHDVDPYGFEQDHFASTMTRSEAIARSKLPQTVSIRIDDQGRAITAPSTLSRAQVAAETREAARLGLLRYTQLGPVQATPEQEQQIRLAGLRAVKHSAAAE
jgi:Tfp pilus assembly protein FimT